MGTFLKLKGFFFAKVMGEVLYVVDTLGLELLDDTLYQGR